MNHDWDLNWQPSSWKPFWRWTRAIYNHWGKVIQWLGPSEFSMLWIFSILLDLLGRALSTQARVLIAWCLALKIWYPALLPAVISFQWDIRGISQAWITSWLDITFWNLKVVAHHRLKKHLAEPVQVWRNFFANLFRCTNCKFHISQVMILGMISFLLI